MGETYLRCRNCGKEFPSDWATTHTCPPLGVRRETVGELVDRLGEQEAYTHIVAYNIQLRAAMVDLIAAVEPWANEQPVSTAIEQAKRALDGEGTRASSQRPMEGGDG